MAALEEGFQYGLSSNSHSSSNKSVVHVKLTDTSLKVIEDYLKRQSSSHQKPCIQFKGNHGTIQIPEQGDNLRAFQFTLSGVQGDPNGSFDAVGQRDTKGGGQLRLEGSMTNKLQVHATSELFNATKDRVTKAELDHKKVSTKEIKHSGMHISKKRTTVLRNSQPTTHPSRHQPAVPSSQSAQSRHQHQPSVPSSQSAQSRHQHQSPLPGSQSTASRQQHQPPVPSSQNAQSRHQHQPPPTQPPAKPRPPANPPQNFVKRPSPSYGSQGHAVSPHTPSTVLSTGKPTSPSLSSHSTTGSAAGGGGGAGTGAGSTGLGGSASHKNSGNSAVMSMPYRDRIIHLLAIRPYKKPELILRLRNDGIREKDKDSLGTVLAQVAVAKDNAFTLNRHLLHTEVRLDWPFYTDDDRQILKKKLQSASSVSPSASPANRSPDSQTTVTTQVKNTKKPETQKRPIEDGHGSAYNAAKKKRISLYEKNEKNEKNLNTSSSGGGGGGGPGGGGDRGSKGGEHHRDHRDHRSSSTDRRSSSNSSSRTDLSDKKENINDTVDSTSDTPEYMKQYFSIASDDQRQKYKADFNQEYTEYRELHANIEKVSKKFYELQILRKKTPKDTIEYEDLEQRIRTEYTLQKKDSKYLDQKRKFDYLHEKLAYIKKLIVDYDQRQLVPTS